MPYQPLPPLLFTAIIGILADRLVAPSIVLWILLCIVALVVWFWFRKYPLILVACAAFFGTWHHEHWYRYAHDDIGCYAPEYRLNAQPAAIIGTVVEMPRFYPKPPPLPGQIFDTSEKTVFTFRAEQLRDGRDWIPVSGKIMVTVFDDGRKYRIGDRLQLFGELQQPLGASNPGDFDYADYLRGLRIRVLLRCSDDSAVALLSSNRLSPGRWIESIRRTGVANLERHLSKQTHPIAEAMIFGVRESVGDEVRQSMIETGTMHLLAISGLHVTLIAGIGAWFLRLLKISRRKTAVAMIIFILFYLPLTDVRTPAIRAVALTCSFAIALYVNRLTSAVNLLPASALVVLLWHPSELFQFGAQLSFIAIGSFLWMPYLYQMFQNFLGMFGLGSMFITSPSSPTAVEVGTLRDVEQIELTSWWWVRRIVGFFRRIIGLFLASLTIWLFVMPILLSHIHVFTLLAVLTNLFIWIPLIPAMACGFITAMIGQVPIIGSVFGFCTDWSFWLLLEMVAWFQRLGGYYWVPGPPSWWNLGFYGAFAFFTFLPVRRPHWKILLTALLVWILIGIAAGYYRDFDRWQNDRLTLTVLSTGHGNSVLITTPENRLIICDVGSLTSPQYATDAMSKSIWRFGKRHIDAILISHPDNDHFNGVTMLLDRFSVGAVLVSPYTMEMHSESVRQSWELFMEKLEAKKIPVRIVADGDDLAEFGLPDSVILHPPKEDFVDQHITNATSLVLRVEHRGVGFLLPGDLDGRDTAPFLLREPMPTEIVMVPHHGGRSTQTDKVLEWTTPKTLLFSTGKLTHNPERLEEYRQKRYEVRSTYEEGAIEINIGKYTLPCHNLVVFESLKFRCH